MKVNCELGKRIFVLFLFASISFNDFSAHAQNIENKQSIRINRSVLTVGREVFSALDAVAILILWNLTRSAQEQEIKIETKWLEGFVLQDLVRPDAEAMKNIWPEDVRTFFQLALVWADIKKLNLFVAKDQEINAILATFSDRNNKIFNTVEPALADELMRSSLKIKRDWIELVIRARTFYRVRGTFERNKSLFNVGWYWHDAAIELPKK